MGKQPEYYDREKLYEEVWTEPVSKVAERYGVSDVAIAKTCRKMHIPVPGRGYWNKVNTGQKLKKTSLPKVDTYPRVRRLFSSTEVEKAKKVERLVPEAFVLEERLLQRESLPEMKIKCDPTINFSNQYIKNTEKKLKESSRKISKTYGYGRCNTDNDEAFEVSIGPDNIHRALVILQTLCDALITRGYSIGPKQNKIINEPLYRSEYARKEISPIYAFLLETCVSFRITETSNKVEIDTKDRKYSYEKFEYVPSGKLCFEITNYSYENYARKKWQDGKMIRVEDQLNDIIINMIKFATIEKENAAQAKIRHELWKIEEQKRLEQEKLARFDKMRSQNLVKEVERLINYNQIKDYIEEPISKCL